MVKRSTVCKFPVARIKKIMQADEEVGKVAHATPIVVCKYDSGADLLAKTGIAKSLELFMQNILEATVREAQQGGQRKLTPVHLKRAVHNNETFDFLKDIVESVKDEGDNGHASGSEPKAKKRRTGNKE